MVITLQARNTLTIPRELRRLLHVEAGDPLEARVEKGSLVLTPVAVVPRTLRLSESGRAKEAEADEDVLHGRVERFDSPESLFEGLDADAGDRP